MVVLFSTLAFLDRHPFRLSAENPLVEGQAFAIEGEGDFLIVLHSPAIAERSERGSYERSWAWVDLVRQEIGPVETVEAENLNQEILQSFGTVIVTQSAANSPELFALVNTLDTFVRHGGTLALELPDGVLRDAFAADGRGGWRQPGTITTVIGVPEEVAAQISEIPLMTRLMGSTRPLEGTQTVLAMDGAPVIYERMVGEGLVLIFDFDVGAELNAIQQGLPSEDGRVSARYPGDPLRTADMVASPALLGSDIPNADLFERYIAHIVFGRARPQFALWPYPDGGRGSLILSHETHADVGRPLWMSIHERDIGNARTATFISPPTSRDAVLEEREEFIGHAALTWSLSADEPGARHPYGVFGIEPIVQTRSLINQLEALERYLGEFEDVQGVYIQNGEWTEEPTRPFQAMLATQTGGDSNQLRYSISYQPSESTPPGFLFGTCQPFMPLDINGLPFNWYETPVCFKNPQMPQDREVLFGSLERAAQDGWAVHVMTSADLFINAPNMDAFDIWRDAIRFAERNDMWIGGVGQLIGFWRNRQSSSLLVNTSQQHRRESDGLLTSIEYNVEIQAQTDEMTIVMPSEFRGLHFASIRRGTTTMDRVPLSDQVETLDFSVLGLEYEMIPLNVGLSNFTIRYEN